MQHRTRRALPAGSRLPPHDHPEISCGRPRTIRIARRPFRENRGGGFPRHPRYRQPHPELDQAGPRMPAGSGRYRLRTHRHRADGARPRTAAARRTPDRHRRRNHGLRAIPGRRHRRIGLYPRRRRPCDERHPPRHRPAVFQGGKAQDLGRQRVRRSLAIRRHCQAHRRKRLRGCRGEARDTQRGDPPEA